MLCVVAEETERVIGERRLATLRELAADAGAATTERDLFAAVDASLSTNRFDLPFAFAYTIGDDGRPEGASADAPAWAYFSAQAPWYRRTATHWVMSAKREETRDRRLARLIEDCAAGRPTGPLARP